MSTVTFEPTLAFAQKKDQQDPLKHFRERFSFPQFNGEDSIYLCGNSLGLAPKTVEKALLEELSHWQTHGVEGHFKGERPWVDYHHFLTQQTAHIAGAKPEEVVVMNTLTTNLHLMMVSFYQPTTKRFKIIMEAGAFPSDQYALESQVKWHGFDPAEAIIEVAPREGELNLRTEDIIDTIEQHGASTALVLFGGVNYYTGQFFDLKAITDAAHKAGAYAGFDLAHAAGNVVLELHDWGADFAVWCSYKYLNSGPGGPSGVFVHERHADNEGLPRFAGWWGHDDKERFLMRKGFKPMRGAEGWQLSNAQIFSFTAHRVSLDIFVEATMGQLRKKSEQLTAFLEYLLLSNSNHPYRILTPSNPSERGCQLSIYTASNGKKLFQHLESNGVISDWREDNLSGTAVKPGEAGVIRVAPVPLYNTYEDVYRFASLLMAYQ